MSMKVQKSQVIASVIDKILVTKTIIMPAFSLKYFYLKKNKKKKNSNYILTSTKLLGRRI